MKQGCIREKKYSGKQKHKNLIQQLISKRINNIHVLYNFFQLGGKSLKAVYFTCDNYTKHLLKRAWTWKVNVGFFFMKNMHFLGLPLFHFYN
ncbi:hypothetical protein DIC78_00495 [Bacillus halotolerans]|nr:hypothetical protein DIC78_00495 [Bacillus halotolerans]